MRFPKEFTVERVHFYGLPAIRIFPGDISAEIINIDAAREIEFDDFGAIPCPVRGYNCIGKSRKLSNSQYDAVARVLLNS